MFFCFFKLPKVASCTNQMGQISIVAMQNSSPKVTECFNVESRILCMAYVPVEPPQVNGEKTTENNHAAATKASETPSVCLGMEDGRYSTLCSQNNSVQELQQKVIRKDVTISKSHNAIMQCNTPAKTVV